MKILFVKLLGKIWLTTLDAWKETVSQFSCEVSSLRAKNDILSSTCLRLSKEIEILKRHNK